MVLVVGSFKLRNLSNIIWQKISGKIEQVKKKSLDIFQNISWQKISVKIWQVQIDMFKQDFSKVKIDMSKQDHKQSISTLSSSKGVSYSVTPFGIPLGGDPPKGGPL